MADYESKRYRDKAVKISSYLLNDIINRYDIFTDIKYADIVEALLFLLIDEDSDMYQFYVNNRQSIVILSEQIKNQININRISNIDSSLQDMLVDLKPNQAKKQHVSNEMLMQVLLQLKFGLTSVVSMLYRPDVESSKLEDNLQLVTFAMGTEDNEKAYHLNRLFSKLSTRHFIDEINRLSKNKAIKQLGSELDG